MVKKKKIIEITVVLLSSILTFCSCENNKNAVNGIDKPIDREENKIADKDDMNIWQPRGIQYGEEGYLAMQNGIYRIDKAGNMERVVECKDAVGTIYNDELYWTILNQHDTTCFLKLNEEKDFVELGKADNTLPLKNMDCDGNNVYIRNALDEVEGYTLNKDGSINQRIPDEKMEEYAEDNAIAEKRQEDVEMPLATEGMLYHFINPGYSERVYGAQFLTKHVSEGEQGKNILILRKDGKETELLSYYDDALIYKDEIVYISSAEKNELSIYDMKDKRNRRVYTFTEGAFELLHVDDKMGYGIWDSTEQEKLYVGIDLESGEEKDFFKTESGKKYIQIGNKIYYEGTKEQKIMVEKIE